MSTSSSKDVSRRPTVVLVHGLFMGRPAMQVLARRLRRQGHVVRCFGYNTVTDPLAKNVARLKRFVEQVEGPVSLVGHSLGGIVSSKAALQLPSEKVTALALLGSPIRGSQAGRAVSRLLRARGPAKLMQDWVGATVLEMPKLPTFTLAGTKGSGLGSWVCKFHEVNDGTVALSETVVAGAVVCKLPVSHTGMLFDERVGGALADWLASVQARAAA